jgi:hypothetical protein
LVVVKNLLSLPPGALALRLLILLLLCCCCCFSHDNVKRLHGANGFSGSLRLQHERQLVWIWQFPQLLTIAKTRYAAFFIK